MFLFWREADPTARRALVAASLGWMLDAFDVMLYALVLTSLRADLGIDARTAGGLQSLTLLASAAGGLLFGIFADRYGRVARADAERAALFGVHGGLRVGADRRAAGGVPDLPRPRHGRRVGERRRARVRDLEQQTSRQGARPDAELVGDRLRAGGGRQPASSRTCSGSAGGRCSLSACSRRCYASGSGAESRSRRSGGRRGRNRFASGFAPPSPGRCWA